MTQLHKRFTDDQVKVLFNGLHLQQDGVDDLSKPHSALSAALEGLRSATKSLLNMHRQTS